MCCNCYNEIKKMIAKELSIDETEVLPESHLQDDLEADSLALLNLAEDISKRYNIELVNDDLVDNPGLVNEDPLGAACSSR